MAIIYKNDHSNVLFSSTVATVSGCLWNRFMNIMLCTLYRCNLLLDLHLSNNW